MFNLIKKSFDIACKNNKNQADAIHNIKIAPTRNILGLVKNAYKTIPTILFVKNSIAVPKVKNNIATTINATI